MRHTVNANLLLRWHANEIFSNNSYNVVVICLILRAIDMTSTLRAITYLNCSKFFGLVFELPIQSDFPQISINKYISTFFFLLAITYSTEQK